MKTDHEPSDALLSEIEQRVYDEYKNQIAGMAKALIRAGWDAAVRAGVVAEEPEAEWEYGTALMTEGGQIWDVEPDPDLASAEEHHRMCLADPSEYEPDSCIIVRRTPGREAGDWVPVKQGDETDG